MPIDNEIEQKRHNVTVDKPIFDKITTLAEKHMRGNRAAMTNILLEHAIKTWRTEK